MSVILLVVLVVVLAICLVGSIIVLHKACVFCDQHKKVCGRQVDNFPHLEDTEWGERCVARMFTPSDAVVLELGGGSGSVSAVVQEKLADKTKHVVVQPQHGMFGGLDALKKTKAKLGCQFHIVGHILEAGEQDQIIAKIGLPTLLVADCENCLVGEYQKNPKLFDSLQMIQVERDDFDNSYAKLFDLLQMKKIHTGKGCDGKCATEVWIKQF